MKISNLNYDLKNKIINYVVMLFGIISILIIILLSVYYLTPNNYQIIKYSEKDYKLDSELNFSIIPKSSIELKNKEYYKYYIKFNSNELNLIVKNCLKSQNLIINSDELIKINYGSDIIITNNLENNINISIQKFIN